MTRKDFVIIAGVLEKAKAYMPELAWQKLVMVTSHELSETNPRFDHVRFAQACGWEVAA
jgi:hypothetical protein